MDFVVIHVGLGSFPPLLFVAMDEGLPAGLASLLLQLQAVFTIVLAVALCIGAAASWGAGDVCTRAARAPDAVALLVWSSLVPPLPLLGLSLGFEGPAAIGGAFAGLDAGGVLALLYVVVLSTAFGFGTWTWLLRRHEASRVAPFTLLVPVVGIAAAWVALDEVPNAAELAGAVVVLAGLALTTSAVRLRRAAPVRAGVR